MKKIWSRMITHRRELGLIYLVQFVLSIIVGMAMYCTIMTYLGESVALDQLAHGFDRTVIMDVLYTYDGALDMVKNVVFILLPLYLILSTILQGGLLFNIKNEKHSIRSQFKEGLKRFPHFLGIAIISILMILLSALIIGLPFSKIIGDPLMTFYSEKPFVWWLLGLLFFFTLVLILIWSWSVSARYAYIKEERFGWALMHGFRYVKQNFIKLLSIGFLLIGIHALLSFIYYLIMGDRGAPSWTIVLFAIVIQQIFSYLRVLIRGWAYVALEEV